MRLARRYVALETRRERPWERGKLTRRLADTGVDAERRVQVHARVLYERPAEDHAADARVREAESYLVSYEQAQL